MHNRSDGRQRDLRRPEIVPRVRSDSQLVAAELVRIQDTTVPAHNQTLVCSLNRRLAGGRAPSEAPAMTNGSLGSPVVLIRIAG